MLSSDLRPKACRVQLISVHRQVYETVLQEQWVCRSLSHFMPAYHALIHMMSDYVAGSVLSKLAFEAEQTLCLILGNVNTLLSGEPSMHTSNSQHCCVSYITNGHLELCIGTVHIAVKQQPTDDESSAKFTSLLVMRFANCHDHFESKFSTLFSSVGKLLSEFSGALA